MAPTKHHGNVTNNHAYVVNLCVCAITAPGRRKQQDDDGSNADQLRGVLEIQPVSTTGKDKDAGTSLFGRRTPSSKGE